MTARLAVLAVAVCLSGCAARAEVVRRDARGGELLLTGPRARATADARELIVEHCDGRYRLLADTTGLASLPASALTSRGRIAYACQEPSRAQTLATRGSKWLELARRIASGH
jgi:hypothetical protein